MAIESISSLTFSDITALKATDVKQLTTDQVSEFSAQQLSWMSADNISEISLAGFAALKIQQLTELAPKQIAALKGTQLATLSTEELNALNYSQLAAVTADQIRNLSEAQIKALTPDSISSLQGTAVAALSFEDLSTEQIAALTGAQTKNLMASQLANATTDQLAAFSNEAASSISAAAIKPLDAADLGVLAFDWQLGNLAVAQFAPQVIASIDPTVFGELQSDMVIRLGADQIQALTTDQILAMSHEQVEQLGISQINQLSEKQLKQINTQYFSSEQVVALFANNKATLLSENAISKIGTAAIHELNDAVIAQLDGKIIAQMSSDQLAALGHGTGFKALTADTIELINKYKLSDLTSMQVGAISAEELSKLSTEAIGALFDNDMNYGLSALNRQQIQAFSGEQLIATGINNWEDHHIESGRINYITSEQVKSMDGNFLRSFGDMSSWFIAKLSDDAIAGFTESAIRQMNSSDVLAASGAFSQVSARIHSWSAKQIAAINTNAFCFLESDIIQSMLDEQLAALTTSQLEAMTRYQFENNFNGYIRGLEMFNAGQLNALDASYFSTEQIQNLCESGKISLLQGGSIQLLASEGFTGLSDVAIKQFDANTINSMTASQLVALGEGNDRLVNTSANP